MNKKQKIIGLTGLTTCIAVAGLTAALSLSTKQLSPSANEDLIQWTLDPADFYTQASQDVWSTNRSKDSARIVFYHPSVNISEYTHGYQFEFLCETEFVTKGEFGNVYYEQEPTKCRIKGIKSISLSGKDVDSLTITLSKDGQEYIPYDEKKDNEVYNYFNLSNNSDKWIYVTGITINYNCAD